MEGSPASFKHKTRRRRRLNDSATADAHPRRDHRPDRRLPNPCPDHRLDPCRSFPTKIATKRNPTKIETTIGTKILPVYLSKGKHHAKAQAPCAGWRSSARSRPQARRCRFSAMRTKSKNWPGTSAPRVYAFAPARPMKTKHTASSTASPALSNDSLMPDLKRALP